MTHRYRQTGAQVRPTRDARWHPRVCLPAETFRCVEFHHPLKQLTRMSAVDEAIRGWGRLKDLPTHGGARQAEPKEVRLNENRQTMRSDLQCVGVSSVGEKEK